MKYLLVFLLSFYLTAHAQSELLLLYDDNQPSVNFTWDSDADQSFVGTIKGTSGAEINVDYGDGFDSTYVLSGTSTSISIDHIYTADGNKQIRITGDLTEITYLDFSSQTALSGDISSLSNLTSLTLLYLSNTSVSGDISSLSNLTSLTALYLSTTSVSGDISSLSNLTSLTALYLYNTSVDDYTSTTLPVWNNNDIRMQSLGLNLTEVDNFLIDLAAAGGTNGSLNIAGTNAARTSASDAAKSTLISNGWTVTVNE